MRSRTRSAGSRDAGEWLRAGAPSICAPARKLGSELDPEGHLPGAVAAAIGAARAGDPTETAARDIHGARVSQVGMVRQVGKGRFKLHPYSLLYWKILAKSHG